MGKAFNKSSYRAIISDFDNSFLPNGTLPNQQIINKIHHLNQSGIVFSLATSRPYPGIIKEVSTLLHLNSPISTRGGAEIIDPISHSFIEQSYIDPPTASQLIDYLLNLGISFFVEENSRIFVLGEPSHSNYADGLSYVDLDVINRSQISKMILRLYLHDNPNQIETYLINSFPQLHIVKSQSAIGKIVLDITSSEANKNSAIRRLAKLLKLSPQQIIGVGDSYNDLPLISACGFKVTTSDAPDELKTIADMIIPPANKQGILTLLNQFL